MRPPLPPLPDSTFEKLFQEELTRLDVSVDSPAAMTSPGRTGEYSEPFVVAPPVDLVGIALSGGGIRSATFNLGLLQGLKEFDLLHRLHYLSTVSGGGYIGGFWSAWRSRPGIRDGDFPVSRTDGVEPREVHHLREFSRFLSPRWGLLEIETWYFFGSVVCAAVPALVLSTAILFLILSVWWTVLSGSSALPLSALSAYLAALTLCALVYLEIQTTRKQCDAPVAASADSALRRLYQRLLPFSAPLTYLVFTLVSAALIYSVRWVPLDPWVLIVLSSRTATPVGVWLATALVLVILRVVYLRFRPTTRGEYTQLPLGRIISRLVALACAWGAGVLIHWAATRTQIEVSKVGSLGAASGALFVWIRKLSSRRPEEAKRGGLAEILKTVAPRLLATIAVVAAAVVCGACLNWIQAEGDRDLHVTMSAALAVVILGLVFFDPNEVGLHPFYRARISRAYLGASNPDSSTPNQEPFERKGDDILLPDLDDDGPIHLVCCAANGLAANPLETLYRGARSAVLSALGFSIGNRWVRWQPGSKGSAVRLSAALTASAAAFNSNMGSKSMDLGSAATFLMSALNLRLGLWVRTSREEWFTRLIPGRLFLCEMFRQTRALERSRAFHLSDGGHFDNTGLYELLRRHCRYILVSDCGADREVAFDDVGNVLRRAREDFGVEVDVDLTPLRPNAHRRSAQHLAIGDITYANGDHGVILLFKPTLIGDEPEDVLQYSARNRAFPHESTGDQFYDEKQWESYRRLGLHAARTTFRFLGGRAASEVSVADVFGRARMEWYPAPPGLAEAAIARTADMAAIERDVAAIPDDELRRGLYPEVGWPAGPSPTPSPAALGKFLPLLQRLMQLYENVYFTCGLERHWSHPMNLGWMNYFGRWVTTPIVRNWWPILSPLYGPKAMRFAEEKFGVRGLRSGAQSNPVDVEVGPTEPVVHGGPMGMALATWLDMDKPVPKDRTWLSLYLHLSDGTRVEVAVVFVRIADRTAEWAADDLFVPPSLWGAGLGERFLELLPDALGKLGVERITVRLSESEGRSQAARKSASDIAQMYRQAGFGLERVGSGVVSLATDR